MQPRVVRRLQLHRDEREARRPAGEPPHPVQVVRRLQVVPEALAGARERARAHVAGGLQLEHDRVGEAVRARLPAPARLVAPVDRQLLHARVDPLGERRARVGADRVARAGEARELRPGDPGALERVGALVRRRDVAIEDEVVGGEARGLEDERMERLREPLAAVVPERRSGGRRARAQHPAQGGARAVLGAREVRRQRLLPHLGRREGRRGALAHQVVDRSHAGGRRSSGEEQE